MACLSSSITFGGCGFNGFGQLQLLPLKTSRTDISDDEKTSNDCSAQSTAVSNSVSSMTPLVSFHTSERPRDVCISSTWDATFFYIEFSSFWATYASPKWLRTLSIAEKHSLTADEGIKRIFMCQNNSLLLQTTKQRNFLVDMQKSNEPICTEILLSKHFTLLTISDSQTYFLDDDGKLYHPAAIKKPIPTSFGSIVSPSLTFTKAACGADHIVLLTDSGCVFSFGLGTRGQLGHGDIQQAKEPILVEALAGIPVKDIACGSWHSLALSEYGDVYSWGWNEDGQLGHSLGSRQPVVALPTLIDGEEDESYSCIGAGSRHSAALLVGGRLRVWGWNKYGQLGNEKISKQNAEVLLHLSYWNTFLIS